MLTKAHNETSNRVSPERSYRLRFRRVAAAFFAARERSAFVRRRAAACA